MQAIHKRPDGRPAGVTRWRERTDWLLPASSIMRSLGRLAGVAAVGLMGSTAAAQLRFASVASECALLHSGEYGQTFAFTDQQDPPISAALMRVMQRNMGNGAAIGDYDNDGDLDVYLLGPWGRPNVLYRNDHGPGACNFSNVTDAVGLGDVGFGRVAHFADLDNDGWQDLLLVNDDEATGLYPACTIYRNIDGTFLNVTDGSGFAPYGHLKGGACLGDYDGDGLLDIYITHWLFYRQAGPAVFEGHNRLYRNLGGFRFEDVTQAVGLGILNRDSFSCVLADFDNDGDPDLYVVVDHSSDVYYRNDGGFFVDDTQAVGARHTGNDMGVAVADFDHDGDLDIYNTNITDPTGQFGTTQYNTLLVNQVVETGTLFFVDEAHQRGVKDTAWGWGVEFVDVENDGDLDLFAVNGFEEFIRGVGGPGHPLLDTPAVLFINDGAGYFTRSSGTGAEVGSDARAAIAFDFDRDGDQDFLVTNVNQPTMLLENRTDSVGRWLDVDLIGGCGVNADAIGSRIHVTVGGKTFMQELMVGGSYLSGRPHEAHFGLGDAVVVDELRIVWSDGASRVLSAVPADQRIIIHRLPGDGDLSGTIDLRDYAVLQRCFSDGPGTLGDPRCSALDFDLNHRIDLNDLSTLNDRLSGPAVVCPVETAGR